MTSNFIEIKVFENLSDRYFVENNRQNKTEELV